jgi:hypothetical protein
MKSLKIFAVCSLAAFAVACGDPVQRNVDQLDSYVTRIENESANFDEADWERADLEFENLCNEIDANYNAMTPEQQKAAMRAIGRYYGMMTKRGIDIMTREAQKAIESVPSIIEGFKDAFDEE